MSSLNAQNARKYYADARNAGHSAIFTSVNADSKDHKLQNP
jgi:hypothetical protein